MKTILYPTFELDKEEAEVYNKFMGTLYYVRDYFFSISQLSEDYHEIDKLITDIEDWFSHYEEN